MEPVADGATDRAWMRLALATGMTGCGRASPNPSVGCAIVRDGTLLATGATESYGDRHAERAAIDTAGGPDAVRGSDIYVTLADSFRALTERFAGTQEAT